jgi:hypothetical protein
MYRTWRKEEGEKLIDKKGEILAFPLSNTT